MSTRTEDVNYEEVGRVTTNDQIFSGTLKTGQETRYSLVTDITVNVLPDLVVWTDHR